MDHASFPELAAGLNVAQRITFTILCITGNSNSAKMWMIRSKGSTINHLGEGMVRIERKKMQLDVDVSPPAFSLKIDQRKSKKKNSVRENPDHAPQMINGRLLNRGHFKQNEKESQQAHCFTQIHTSLVSNIHTKTFAEKSRQIDWLLTRQSLRFDGDKKYEFWWPENSPR